VEALLSEAPTFRDRRVGHHSHSTLRTRIEGVRYVTGDTINGMAVPHLADAREAIEVRAGTTGFTVRRTAAKFARADPRQPL